jgi:HEPN domain-containing protein
MLKGALKYLGVEYPKVHDVAPVFTQEVRRKLQVKDHKVLERIEDISLWLSQTRAPSFYFEHDYGQADAQRALQDATFVLEQLRSMFDVAG